MQNKNSMPLELVQSMFVYVCVVCFSQFFFVRFTFIYLEFELFAFYLNEIAPSIARDYLGPIMYKRMVKEFSEFESQLKSAKI
jgi:hypothetical protein